MSKARKVPPNREIESTILASILGEAIGLARERLKELFSYADVKQLETWKRVQWLQEPLWDVRLHSPG